MMLLERWVVAALLGLGMASTVVAPGQSPTGTAQQKQPAQPVPELPPWDSAQPPPPSQPEPPDDSAQQPDTDQPMPAQAQDQPAQTTQDQPAQTTQDQPAQTTQDQPAQNTQDQPAQNTQEQPAQTTQDQPAQAAQEEPPAQAVQPAHPADPEQQRLEKDTAHLLELSQDLKAEVDKAGSNTLSLTAVRKADEIQRLVKSLKERMKERGQVFVNKP